jgi:DNA-binding transcriptional ArsR family regulator
MNPSTPLSPTPTSPRALVTNHAQAEVLLEEPTQEIIGALMEGFSSASEIAKNVKKPLKTVLYRLERLLAVGLVLQNGERKRSGRAVKLYQLASEDGWDIPFSLTPAHTARELVSGQLNPRINHFFDVMGDRLAQSDLTIRISKDPQNKITVNISNPEQRGNSVGSFSSLQLSTEQAKEIARELRELIQKYQALEHNKDLDAYMLGIFFAQDT